MPQQKTDLPNFNNQTGFPYGVIHGHSCPELLDDIFTHGTDRSWEADVKAIKDAVRDAVLEAVSPYVVFEDRLADRVTELLEDELGDYLEPYDEPEYVHTEQLPGGKQITYQLGWLGGAPHIWVLDSPYLAWCRPCSPCIPWAGDLDTLVGKDEGMLAHSVPPDCFPEEIQAKLKQAQEGGRIILWVDD